METFPTESPRLELLDPATPSRPSSLRHVLPLRIIKRSDSSCGWPSGNTADHAPRSCSQETDGSRGSAPDLPGGQNKLTVPKIRGHRNSQMFGSLDEVDETPVPLGREPYLPIGVFSWSTATDWPLTAISSILGTRWLQFLCKRCLAVQFAIRSEHSRRRGHRFFPLSAFAQTEREGIRQICCRIQGPIRFAEFPASHPERISTISRTHRHDPEIANSKRLFMP